MNRSVTKKTSLKNNQKALKNVLPEPQLIEDLQKKLGYFFINNNLLQEALTHKSFCTNEFKDSMHNERLEFLGDGLLGFVMAEHLMLLFPQDNEGALSKKRASLVNQDILMQKALSYKLDQLLIMGPGEKAQESHLKPRILASAFEALIGALYFDAGIAWVKTWIEQQFIKDIELIKPDLEFEKDYKTRLQELTQKLKLGAPVYKLIMTQGPSHNPEFLVGIYLKTTENKQTIEKEMFRASGKSKKAAEQACAQLLMQILINQEERKI